MPFNSIPLDHPDLAAIPDQPGRKATAGPALLPVRYFINRSPEQRSPDRQASIARRRSHAASGIMPKAMAARLTTSEQAVAYIIAEEFLAHGICDLSRNEIGSRAGVSQRFAERTILRLESVEFCWLQVTRRPRSGRKHLTNLTKIVSPEWLAWLAHGAKKAAAIRNCRNAHPDFKFFRGDNLSPPRGQGIKTTKSGVLSATTQAPNQAAAREGGGPS